MIGRISVFLSFYLLLLWEQGILILGSEDSWKKDWLLTNLSSSSLRRLESNMDYTKPEVQQRPVTLNFDKALELINKVTNLIYQRFEFANEERFQFFLGSSNMPVYGWDLIKYKIAQKIVNFAELYEGKTDITSANVNESQQYLMTFGGTSVTASHDNYYHQSYPFVFERRMVEIFHQLGMKLVVHNIAQGSNNCRPSDYCYEAMGGDNPDFVSWEQSFNCGRARDIPEYMARVAYWSGGVAYYVASGAFMPSDCQPTKDPIPWTAETWTPEAAGIQTKYEVTPEKAAAYKTLLGSWYDDGNSVSRWTNQVFGGLYRGVGPHGYSVWAHSSKLCDHGKGCDAINMKGPCYESGGPHWMVQETSYYAGEKGTHGKSWHPPAGMHLMRGEILAYNYAHILADAIYMIREDLKSLSKSEAKTKYQKVWEELRTPIPERALHLSAAEGSDRAYCYTEFTPHFNPKYLLSAILLKNTAWTRKEKHHDDYSSQRAKFGYQDSRPSFEGVAGGSEIYVRLDRVRSGEVRVCGYDIKHSLSHVEMYLDPNYPFPADKKTTEVVYEATAKRYPVTNIKEVGDQCHLLWDVPRGDGHVLIIRTKDTPANHVSLLSHIIIF